MSHSFDKFDSFHFFSTFFGVQGNPSKESGHVEAVAVAIDPQRSNGDC